jgi:DNA-binding TFAR19-related protein (PDSD5 family)
MAEDSELAAIRARRLAEMQAQAVDINHLVLKL